MRRLLATNIPRVQVGNTRSKKGKNESAGAPTSWKTLHSVKPRLKGRRSSGAPNVHQEKPRASHIKIKGGTKRGGKEGEKTTRSKQVNNVPSGSELEKTFMTRKKEGEESLGVDVSD